MIKCLCPNCGANLLDSHFLDDFDVRPTRNKSRIIHPSCSFCHHFIQLSDVSKNINKNRNVLLITGTGGAGKSSLGQLIESETSYIFIDGDSVSRRESHYARLNPNVVQLSRDNEGLCTLETINTMMVVCALGYNVVVGYLIETPTILSMYENELNKYSIKPIFRVLMPNLDICIKRDLERDCWTAGEKWVNKPYDKIHHFLSTHPSCCLDTSYESLDETFKRHFKWLL